MVHLWLDNHFLSRLEYSAERERESSVDLQYNLECNPGNGPVPRPGHPHLHQFLIQARWLWSGNLGLFSASASLSLSLSLNLMWTSQARPITSSSPRPSLPPASSVLAQHCPLLHSFLWSEQKWTEDRTELHIFPN